ncbi:MAG TPA: hypothetical protein VMW72_16570 [Sedimentisphaerales bacterium]|nr:hypothetical protein [Sedimentisphaerales bacterium]
MSESNREIHELLVDYAGALRDGCIPAFLKSLTREEAERIASSWEFWDATEISRILNSVGFADKAVAPNVSLFISRVDAEIASRLKKSKASPPGKRSTNTRVTKREDKTEKSI